MGPLSALGHVSTVIAGHGEGLLCSEADNLITGHRATSNDSN